MSENLSLYQSAEEWSKFVIERWERMIQQLKIGQYTDTPKHELAKSFQQHVNANSNGDPDRIDFTFNYYGKFVDMGVGNGMTRGSKAQLGESFYAKRNDLGQLHSHNRKAKPWYSKIFFTEIAKLRIIMAENYANKAQMTIIDTIQKTEL